MDDCVLFSAPLSGQIFTFTHSGTFTGNLARDGDCEGPDSFAPYRIAEIDNMVYATCHKENAVKALIGGKVTSSITTRELGFPSSKPMSIAVNDYYLYVSLDNGNLLSLYYGLELAEAIDIECVTIEADNDHVYALTSESKLVTFDVDLNIIKMDDYRGHYINQLTDPVDMAIDECGNLWFVQEDRCVTVWYENGGYGSWGDKYVDRFGSHWGISGDPIVGRDGVFPATSIEAGDDYFYLTRNSGHGLAVPKDLVNYIPDPSVHFISIFMSGEDYNEYAVDVWKLQQYLYPRVLLAVFDIDRDYNLYIPENGIYLDGEFVTGNLSELTDYRAFADSITDCMLEKPMILINHDLENNSVSVDLNGLPNPFDIKLLLLNIKGSKSPLLADSIEIFRPDRFAKIDAIIPMHESPGVVYAIVLDSNEQCIGARIIRD